MRICPGCRSPYEDASLLTCPQDGLPLIETSKTFPGLSLEDSGEHSELTLGKETQVRPGMKIGDYLVERVIASGGMGAVYAGIHPVIAKRVAIKVLSRRYSKDPKTVARFVLEARSVNEIHHHSIVDIFAIGELNDGRNYMVMELLDGVALHVVLARAKRLTPGQLIPLYEQLCDALQAAHDKGFVHRDLKPENVIVLRRPPVPLIKILDFGIAKLRGTMTSAAGSTENTAVGTVLGTPEYMAPEQCLGGEVDARTDIYALGVMLYQLSTGQLPFDDPMAISVLKMQVINTPKPPSAFGVPKALEALILKAMAKKPPDRHPSARALFEELSEAVEARENWPRELVAPPKAARSSTLAGSQTPPPLAMPPSPQVEVPEPESNVVNLELPGVAEDEAPTLVNDSKRRRPPSPEVDALPEAALSELGSGEVAETAETNVFADKRKKPSGGLLPFGTDETPTAVDPSKSSDPLRRTQPISSDARNSASASGELDPISEEAEPPPIPRPGWLDEAQTDPLQGKASAKTRQLHNVGSALDAAIAGGADTIAEPEAAAAEAKPAPAVRKVSTADDIATGATLPIAISESVADAAAEAAALEGGAGSIGVTQPLDPGLSDTESASPPLLDPASAKAAPSVAGGADAHAALFDGGDHSVDIPVEVGGGPAIEARVSAVDSDPALAFDPSVQSVQTWRTKSEPSSARRSQGRAYMGWVWVVLIAVILGLGAGVLISMLV